MVVDDQAARTEIVDGSMGRVVCMNLKVMKCLLNNNGGSKVASSEKRLHEMDL